MITVNDIVCYCLFVVSYIHPESELRTWTDWLRYAGGSVLLFLNLLVRIDARRVVKDFAWCKFSAVYKVIRSAND
jgi:phosphatidylethanolamine N-methyltransferase